MWAVTEIREASVETLHSPTGGVVAALACSPLFDRDGTVLAGSPVQIHRSTNSGDGWHSTAGNLGKVFIEALAFSPNLAEDGIAFAASDAGVLISADGGGSWDRLTRWPHGVEATALAVSANFARDLIVFAGTVSEGVLRSTNAGLSWEPCNFRLGGREVSALAISPDYQKDETLFVATERGVFRSPNGGRAWTGVKGGEDLAAECLLISPYFARDHTLWIGTRGLGIWCSTNGGRSCERDGGKLQRETVAALAALPGYAGGRPLLAATGSGVFRSTDGGVTWRTLDSSTRSVLCFAAATGKQGGEPIAFAGTAGGGVRRSRDGGRTWETANDDLYARLTVGLLIPPGLASDLTILTWDLGEGILISNDGGDHWTAANDGIESLDVTSVQASNGFSRDGTLMALAGGSVYLSRDGGRMWRCSLSSPEASIGLLAMSPEFGSDGIAYALAGHLLFATEDGGANWNASSHQFESQRVVAVAILHGSERLKRIVALTRSDSASEPQNSLSIWMSADAGQSWINQGACSGAGQPTALVVAPGVEYAETFFLATGDEILHIDLDNPKAGKERARWGGKRISEDGTTVLSLAASPAYTHDGTLLAGTTRGVFRSTDNGRSWACIAEPGGLPVLQVATSSNYRRNGLVYALTIGGGLWRLGT